MELFQAFLQLLEETTDIVENRHTGIATMREEMNRANLPEPDFEVLRGTFKVTFWKENKGAILENYTENYTEKLNSTQLKIIKLIRENPLITQKMLVENLGLSRAAITLNIKELKNKGYIERVGSDRKGYWKIINNKM